VLDGDEDNDGDGTANKDEPTIFSLEAFRDPFANPPRDAAIVIEGTNLFGLLRSIQIDFPDGQRSFRVKRRARLNRTVRVYLRVSRRTAKVLLGALKIRVGDRDTNVLNFVPMHCDDGGPPKLMGAAFVHLKTVVDDKRYDFDYVAVGGCNLIERRGRRARTRIRLLNHDVRVKAPYGGIATLPSRVLVPAHGFAIQDPQRPVPDEIAVGDMVSVETSLGESNQVVVEPPIAQIRIPARTLDEDHDEDGLPSGDEIRRGTDPLGFDSDGDGLSDGREVASGIYDPLDPDTDGDGILDGAEQRATVPPNPY
jgi:hypothetical protein